VHRIGICVSDSVCNRHLAPVLQACMAEQCESDLCEKETQQFYRNMPQNAAEMLVMCECEASDQSCLQMKAGLQTGRCGDETRICQERLYQCVEDSNCRYVVLQWYTMTPKNTFLKRKVMANSWDGMNWFFKMLFMCIIWWIQPEGTKEAGSISYGNQAKRGKLCLQH